MVVVIGITIAMALFPRCRCGPETVRIQEERKMDKVSSSGALRRAERHEHLHDPFNYTEQGIRTVREAARGSMPQADNNTH